MKTWDDVAKELDLLALAMARITRACKGMQATYQQLLDYYERMGKNAISKGD